LIDFLSVSKMPKGGKRAGAGRKRSKADMPVADRLLASRCLDLAEDAKPKNPREKRWHEFIWERGSDGKLTGKALEATKYLTDREGGRPVQQVRLANPEGEKFQVEVDVISARDRLAAALSR
jgi:hypothetical protein